MSRFVQNHKNGFFLTDNVRLNKKIYFLKINIFDIDSNSEHKFMKYGILNVLTI